MHRRYKRPVWLTEFACPPAGGATLVQAAAANQAFFRAAAKWLDAQAWVERCVRLCCGELHLEVERGRAGRGRRPWGGG